MSDLSKMSDAEVIAYTNGVGDTVGQFVVRAVRGDGVDELARRLAAMTAERDELSKVVAKLPKTADGVPGVPGMVLWGWIERYDGTPGAVHQQNWMTAKAEEIAKCYSTREAAEAARCGGEVGNG